MRKVFVTGEILVEVMADEKNQTFDSSGGLTGPFPSGAPAIFIDQVAQFNVPCSIIGSVGRDDFGKLCLKRLEEDGVDISNIKVVSDVATGVAFVRYQDNGNRNFIYHIGNAACGKLTVEDFSDIDFSEAGVFHIMGSSIFNEEMFEIHKTILDRLPEDCLVSFDPNIRPEILAMKPDLKELLFNILDRSYILFMTIEELEFMTGENCLNLALQKCYNKGNSIIVVKNGSKGASVYSVDETYHAEPYLVKEVDPTGAGDTFAGAFIAGIISGWDLQTCLNRANKAGASAVMARGPMEGTLPLEKIKDKLV